MVFISHKVAEIEVVWPQKRVAKWFIGHDFLYIVFKFKSSGTYKKEDTSDLLNSGKLKTAIAQLYNELQVRNQSYKSRWITYFHKIL